MNVLVLTVGGSPQPLLTALSQGSWAHIWFLCSADNPETGDHGSASMVIGSTDADNADREPTLPERAGLDPKSYTIETVKPDHLDDVVQKSQVVFEAARTMFDQPLIHADYTGGTKTMSAGLTLAAVAESDVRVQVTTATRSNLVRVETGERPSSAATGRTRLEHALKPLLRQFAAYGYEEAATGFQDIKTQFKDNQDILASEKRRIEQLEQISRGLAAWDRHAYAEARRVLTKKIFDTYEEMKPYWSALEHLKEPINRQPMVIADLLNNAERRAARGHYDEAVARAYRLTEWTAQWLLWEGFRWKTDNIPHEQLPEQLKNCGNYNDKGNLKIGLMPAWLLVEHKMPESPLVQMMHEKDASGKTNHEQMFEFIKNRNKSYLAHGDEKVSQESWTAFRDWIVAQLFPALREEARNRGKHLDVPQLPSVPPKELLR